MAERKIVVDNVRINYKGLFNMRDFYRVMDGFFKEKGYDKREVRNNEYVKPEGKHLELWLEPYKKITDYAKLIIRLQVIIQDLREVVVEREGHKKKMQKGDIQVIIDGFLETDYENRWEGRPEYVFVRTLFDKFIYRRHTTQFEAMLVEETDELQATLKSFLNLFRY